VLPLATPEKVEAQYEQMLMIRDRLNLPPHDPIHELLEAKIAKTGEDPEAALREAEQKFEIKRREVRILKEPWINLKRNLRAAKGRCPTQPRLRLHLKAIRRFARCARR